MFAQMFQLLLCITVAVSITSALYTPHAHTISSRGSPALAHQSLNVRAARILIKRQTGDFPASEDGDFSISNTNRKVAADSPTILVAPEEDTSTGFSGVGEDRFNGNGGAGETDANGFAFDASETYEDGLLDTGRRRVERAIEPKPRRPFGKHGSSSRKIISPSMKKGIRKTPLLHIS